MKKTALSAEKNGKENIYFISEAHEKFYYEKLSEVRHPDVYHKAFFYCIGISVDTRNHVDDIYDMKNECVKPECLNKGWQTSGSVRVVRMAFNLYCNGMPTVNDKMKKTELMREAGNYSVEEIFCCSYAPFFWQAVQIRYSEYAIYNRSLYEMFGGDD